MPNTKYTLKKRPETDNGSLNGSNVSRGSGSNVNVAKTIENFCANVGGSKFCGPRLASGEGLMAQTFHVAQNQGQNRT